MRPETESMAQPQLYDLTELQRHANRMFGFSAQKTLDTAQALYERHKLISYPRTDSRHLSQDVADTLPQIVKVIEVSFREHLAPGTGERPLGRRFIDDSKVTDHHAIIPTAISPEKTGLSAEESKIYDLICRRLLSAWQDDHIWSVTTVITAVRNGDSIDRFHTSGSAIQQVGWKVLDISAEKKTKSGKVGGDELRLEQVFPPGRALGQPQDVVDIQPLKKKPRPPTGLTEATLLTAMETAGKTLDEKELSEAMKETGLGTPATRAAIIEVLLKRGYIVRDGKSLEATDKGIRLIEIVHAEVKSPSMTGHWEAYLKRIERGTAQLEPFLTGIEDYVQEVVGKVGQTRPIAKAAMLKGRGFDVDLIHAGRDRAASRQACLDYLTGKLQFLFIAPERLRVAGFPEMLAKRKPSLIAIDEAHCISQWGHDFRPDYRMLGQYLPTLRPAPVIALTATATPVVQNDIAVQSGLAQPARFIQGFRPDNLAIKVVEVAPSQRAALTLELLIEEVRRPAIVYTPTRAQATSVAADPARHFPCPPYPPGPAPYPPNPPPPESPPPPSPLLHPPP